MMKMGGGDDGTQLRRKQTQEEKREIRMEGS